MKRRFEFRLQRLARVRDIEERLAREERALAEVQARQAEDERDRVRRALHESRAELALSLAQTVDPRAALSAHRLIDQHQRLLGLRMGEASRVRRLAQAAAEAHRARRSDSEAMKKLRERALLHHREALAREENALMDEVASVRARRQALARRPERAPGAQPPRKPETDSRRAPSSADQAPASSPERAS